MKVTAVSITKSLLDLDLPEQMSAEELIVYIARVSSEQRTEESVRLIKYLIKHKHWSPFEMANLCVEVVTSRAIAHQILRHWSLSVQEFSQRYAQATEFEPIELRKNGATNRQSSLEVFDPNIYVTDEESNMIWSGKAGGMIEEYLLGVKRFYKALIEAGVAKECARMILPLTTQTKMYLNGSVRDWIHYLSQRTSEHTQIEHRIVAIEIEMIFAKYFPNIAQAIKEYLNEQN